MCCLNYGTYWFCEDKDGEEAEAYAQQLKEKKKHWERAMSTTGIGEDLEDEWQKKSTEGEQNVLGLWIHKPRLEVSVHVCVSVYAFMLSHVVFSPDGST